MAGPAPQHADVSDPRLYREDSLARRILRGCGAEDPVHRHARQPLRALLVGDPLRRHHEGRARPRRPIRRPRSWAASRSPTSPRARSCPTSSAWTRRATPRSARRWRRSWRRPTSPTWRRRSAQRTDGACSTACRATRRSTGSTASRPSSPRMMLATLFDFPWPSAASSPGGPTSPSPTSTAEDAVVKSEAERMAELTHDGRDHGRAVEGARRAAAQVRPDLDDGPCRRHAGHADATSSSATSPC